MDHLQKAFGHSPSRLVIMLQAVTRESLTAILAHSWVRDNFSISNVDAPGHNMIMIISKDIHVERLFRMPLATDLGNDALVVDLPIDVSKEQYRGLKRILRLCTVDFKLGPAQMTWISALLKALPQHDTHIVAGLVGGVLARGFMAPFSSFDETIYKIEDFDLHDIWEETYPPSIPPFRPGKKDVTFGRAKGNTWGYHETITKAARLDKFLYTGSVDIFALDEVADRSGKIGRLGIHLKAMVEVWEC